MIKHVWFDMGGTLYRETPEFDIAHDELRFKTYAKLVGIDDPNRAKKEFNELYKKHGSNSAVFRSLGQSSDFWMKAFEEMDLSNIIQPDSDINKTLSAVRSKLPISIFTNIRPAKLKEMLSELQIPIEWFTHIISGDDVSERKPHLEGFWRIVELSKVPASDILYVGDRVDVDVKPAKQVGMKTCLVWAPSPEADYSAVKFPELVKIISSTTN